MTSGAIVLAGGCSIFSGLDDFASEDPGAASDAGASADVAAAIDAASETAPPATSADASLDAVGDADAARVNLHTYGTMEGCNSWGAYKAILAGSSEARTGTGSCLVCPTGEDPIFTADDNGAVEDPALGTYVAEVWVWTAPGKTAPPDIGLSFRTRNDTPTFAEVEKSYAEHESPSSTWVKITTTLTVTKPAQKLNVVVGAESAGSPCFLLDDVAIYRTK